jgi:hypothetical protein
MVYEYYCSMCGGSYDIEKWHTEASREEICEKCNITLTRVFHVPSLSFATLSIREKSDLEKYKAKGTKLECVGNDRPVHAGPKMTPYTLPREVMNKVLS